MPNSPKFETQHVATVPPGYHVRTVKARGHEVRIAFPPGQRRKGSGKVVEILHPIGENGCLSRSNPMELLVMGANPMRSRSNPLDSFTPHEKMMLGMLKIKWSEIRTAADARRARAKIAKFERLRSTSNPAAQVAPNSIGYVPLGEPEEHVREIHEGFLQAETDRIDIAHEPHIPGGNYAQLGVLYSLHIKPGPNAPDRYVKNFLRSEKPPIRVLSDATRRQIYFAEGNQALTDAELRAYGCGSENICEVGEVRQIWYVARKFHAQLEPEFRGKVTIYRHRFGERTNITPVLFYDRRLRRLILTGGDYKILDEGIEN